MTEKSLIVAETLDAVALYTEGGMNIILTEIEAKVKAFKPDVSTEESRKEITSFAYKIARSKTLLDDLGKELVSEKKKEVKKVDAVRKEARDFCDNLKAGVRKPLDEWEAEETVKKEEAFRIEQEKIEARCFSLAEFGMVLPWGDVAGMSDEEYGDAVAKAKDKYDADVARMAEEERLKEERKAKEEADRKAEAEKLAKEREDLDKRRVEQEAAQAKIDEANRKTREAQEATQKKLDAERAAIEKEKAVREAAAVARNLAIKEEREAQERNAREKEEAEKRAMAERVRKAEMRPDIDKIYEFAGTIADITSPEVKSQGAMEILAWASNEVKTLSDLIKMKADDL